MRSSLAIVCIALTGVIVNGIWAQYQQSHGMTSINSASQSCLSCHNSNSRYRCALNQDLTVQVFSAEFADSTLRPVNPPIQVGDATYTVELDEYGGSLIGRQPSGSVKYGIQYAVRRKQVYYLLTPLTDGHLQVLPLAFDLRTRCWFSTGASLPQPNHGPAVQGLPPVNKSLKFDAVCGECHRIEPEERSVPVHRNDLGTRTAAIKY